MVFFVVIDLILCCRVILIYILVLGLSLYIWPGAWPLGLWILWRRFLLFLLCKNIRLGISVANTWNV